LPFTLNLSKKKRKYEMYLDRIIKSILKTIKNSISKYDKSLKTEKVLEERKEEDVPATPKKRVYRRRMTQRKM